MKIFNPVVKVVKEIVKAVAQDKTNPCAAKTLPEKLIESNGRVLFWGEKNGTRYSILKDPVSKEHNVAAAADTQIHEENKAPHV